MIVRLGYVAMSMEVKNASPSKTMTATAFGKLGDREAAIRKLERIAAENLHNTLRLLRHNRAHDIHVYRFSSKLIPLIGHELLEGWDPFPALREGFAEIGQYVRQHHMRVSFHPDHFTVLSTPRLEVLGKSIADLERHVAMLEAMGLGTEAMCNIHVGGTYGDKAKAGERFVKNFGKLRPEVRRRMTLENDDKTFTALETLELAERVRAPLVLDIHHHEVNPGSESAAELWPRIQATWAGRGGAVEAAGADRGDAGGRPETAERAAASGAFAEAEAGAGAARGAVAVAAPPRSGEAQPAEDVAGLPRGSGGLPPKIHVSSPKSEKDPRSHADYVEAGPLLAFLREIAPSTPRLDVMIEAKMKDGALARLMDDLRQQADVTPLDQASFELKA
ncbi:UV DNA damage repair endonuclease UvsE [Paenibacillus athensensis]|uniref:UV damage repair endonuclease UvsE n=1 Tax=Paenibacillus athensensis TaxID=1967502 RepID=A0A4Y8PVH8_9BACL|nr:UV DNA damage repair endonuclease UvsE [Paenibacillus athensensis]MCD1258751.1 UV DNA damage repair endonuclease UvsE [Paenibacillus athensensis]